MNDDQHRSPLDGLGALARQEVDVAPGLRHVEVYTLEGLLTLLWHGDPAAECVVLACGGAMGGLLGPAGGLYHDLGTRFAAQQIGTIRVGYRRPNDLASCVHDLLAAAEMARRRGARRFVTMGHSFGGAVALRAAIVLGREHCAGVVGLATQSAGCEEGDRLGDTPLLLLHGEHDELLPPETSRVVQMIAGGQVVILPGTGHLLTESGEELRKRLGAWIPERLAG